MKIFFALLAPALVRVSMTCERLYDWLDKDD